MNMYFVYAYSMREANLFDEDNSKWPLLCATRIVSYHECAKEAGWEVSRLINEDDTNPDECFGSEAIPLGAVHEHNQV